MGLRFAWNLDFAFFCFDFDFICLLVNCFVVDWLWTCPWYLEKQNELQARTLNLGDGYHTRTIHCGQHQFVHSAVTPLSASVLIVKQSCCKQRQPQMQKRACWVHRPLCKLQGSTLCNANANYVYEGGNAYERKLKW